MNADLGCEEFGRENDKEIALASAPVLQPNFMSKSITKEQIANKLQFGRENDKEISLASAPVLQPNFMSKSITKEQIAKLQALRHRRLQLKHTSDFPKKKVTSTEKLVHKGSFCSLNHGNSSTPVMQDGGSEGLESNHQKDKSYRPRKRLQKLRWGLDVKERWERKGNM